MVAIGFSNRAVAKPHTEQPSAPGAALRQAPPVKRVLWMDSPRSVSETVASREWERSVCPLGNGRLGCTAFGYPRKERIQFKEDSPLVGNEDCTGGYQPFGDVYVEMSHAEYSDYRRELDDPKDTHRHINHMIAVYPGRQMRPGTTPQLAEAAKVSLMARGDFTVDIRWEDGRLREATLYAGPNARRTVGVPSGARRRDLDLTPGPSAAFSWKDSP